MATRQDITVPSDQFISINAYVDPEQGTIPVGTALEIQLKGIYPVLIFESTTKPDDQNKNGPVLSDMRYPVSVSAGSDEIWVKTLSDGSGCKISVTIG